MSAPDIVKKLVNHFGENIDSFRSKDYKETRARIEFIDPMFEAMGWDVRNERELPEAYKDVVHEDTIKVGSAHKAPDYCFRIGGARKFFLEAKKPGVNLKKDSLPAYQLRRYAWSAKLPLSILTDFEEFAVYDGRVRPAIADKPSAARINYITFDQYIDRWDEIDGTFGNEAVLGGSFDKYVAGAKKKKGTAEVDAAFLKEIESWREILAKNIAVRNKGLSQRDLNFAVQKTIDRIIFLRICEDRGIEHYGRLLGLVNGAGIYKRMFKLFRDADDRYNSGLFHFTEERDRDQAPDHLTPGLEIDDKHLKKIIKSLYYPDSPYEFSVLPAEILGNVYEQFLGKVIRLTAGHQAKVEEKPEVRKAGGVYYTPDYIVDYIVENTVGKLLERNAGSLPAEEDKSRQAAGATGPISIRERGRLPHWEAHGATYFVTYRQADSLPKTVLADIENEREKYILAQKAKVKLSKEDKDRIKQIFSEKIEDYLDSGAGECHLRDPRIAEIVKENLLKFDGTKYRIYAWCIMPNHVHVVMEPLVDHELAKILHSWKSFTSNKINKKLGLKGKLWQREYYDHLVRDQADYERVVDYVWENPKKAGLSDWEWVGFGSNAGSLPAEEKDKSRQAAGATLTPKQISNIKILDPACGSGSFLIGAYQYLLDWHLEWYVAEYKRTGKIPTSPPPPGKRKKKSDTQAIFQTARSAGKSNAGSLPAKEEDKSRQAAGATSEESRQAAGATPGEWRLTTDERKRILLNNIHGVDIDTQAVEVTKLSLLLKVLEGETEETIVNQMKLFHQRALPDLAANIKCGNSLIGPDFYEGGQMDMFDEEEMYRINVFDWEDDKHGFGEIMKAGGFDVVIGNPPYLNIDDTWGKGDVRLGYIKRYYNHVYNDKTDILFYFIAKAISLSKHRIGFIVSRAFLEAYKANKLRVFISEETSIQEIVDFRNLQIFKGVGITTSLLFIDKSKLSLPAKVFQLKSEDLSPMDLSKQIGNQDYFDCIDVNQNSFGEKPWFFAQEDVTSILDKIDHSGMPLEKFFIIGQGMQTGRNNVFGKINKEHIEELCADESQYFVRARNSDIERYKIEDSGEYLLYLEDVSTFDDLPDGIRLHLKEHEQALKNRAAYKRGDCDWWRFTWPLHKEHIDKVKIYCPYLSKYNRFALDTEKKFLGLTDTTVLFYDNQPESIHYFLGLLNSRLLSFRFKYIGKLKSGGILEYFWNSISKIPIRPIDPSSPSDISLHDRMVSLVTSMLDLHRRLVEVGTPHEKEAVQRRIDATDNEIDRLVYELYGLTEDEVGIVEGS